VVATDGKVEPGFEAVAEAFAANFERRGEHGAAVCVYAGGRPVVDLWGGPTYGPDTLQLVFSATKGMATVCVGRLVEQGRLDPEAPVAEYWAAFDAAGKAGVTVDLLLSHRAGLPAVDRALSFEDMLAWEPLVEALAEQPPLWEPGTRHGYHALTFGHLAGELVRRMSGRRIGRFFAEEVAAPLGLDAWIGLPAGEEGRVADLIPPEASPDDPMTKALADTSGLTYRAFANPPIAAARFNRPDAHAAEIPAANGITTARSLARMYAACVGEIDGVRLLAPATVELLRRSRAAGPDAVLPYDTQFGLGFQLPAPWRPFAGPGSFGHYGMGGSVGFALPEAGLALGYTIDRMQSHAGPDPRSQALIAAALACLR